MNYPQSIVLKHIGKAVSCIFLLQLILIKLEAFGQHDGIEDRFLHQKEILRETKCKEILEQRRYQSIIPLFMSFGNDTTTTFKNKYEFDDMGNLIQFTQYGSMSILAITYTRDARGRYYPYIYKYSDLNGKLKRLDKFKFQCNSNGLITTQLLLRGGKEITRGELFTYNDSGKILSQIIMDHENTYEVLYKYDDCGKLIERQGLQAISLLHTFICHYIWQYEYDKTFLIRETERVAYSNEISEVKKYSYDLNGYLIEVATNTKYSHLVGCDSIATSVGKSIKAYKNDEHGRVLTEVTTSDNGGHESSTFYQYVVRER